MISRLDECINYRAGGYFGLLKSFSSEIIRNNYIGHAYGILFLDGNPRFSGIHSGANMWVMPEAFCLGLGILIPI